MLTHSFKETGKFIQQLFETHTEVQRDSTIARSPSAL